MLPQRSASGGYGLFAVYLSLLTTKRKLNEGLWLLRLLRLKPPLCHPELEA